MYRDIGDNLQIQVGPIEVTGYYALAMKSSKLPNKDLALTAHKFLLTRKQVLNLCQFFADYKKKIEETGGT